MLFLANLAELQHNFEQNLLLAQQEFEEKMQIFIKQRNTLSKSQLSYQSAPSNPHCTLPLAATRPQLEQIMIHKSVDPPVDTSGYPSPLNTQFLLASGDYNTAVTSIHWFNSSLFCLLPFFQKKQALPTCET